MKNFEDIQHALDFAATNRDRLKFPFTCKCNRLVLRVLSPDLARTLPRSGPSLVVSRTHSRALELAFVLSVNALEELVKSVCNSEGYYGLLCRDGQVSILFYRDGRLVAEFSFPVARRIPEAAAEDGDFVLLTGAPKPSHLRRFWLPLECRLLQSSMAAA
jgi:hypothetical protein